MTFIVDNNFDDVLASMKARGYDEAYQTNAPASVYANLDGHAVLVLVQRKTVKGHLTNVATWNLDGKRCGFNAVRGALREGA